MPCDRCGGRLVEYELQGRVSTICEECESIDVLVEHEPQSRLSESWDEALDRFHEQSQQSDDADAAVPTSQETEPDPDSAPSDTNTDGQSGDGSESDAQAAQDDPAAPADGDDSEGNNPTSRRRQAIKKVPRE